MRLAKIREAIDWTCGGRCAADQVNVRPSRCGDCRLAAALREVETVERLIEATEHLVRDYDDPHTMARTRRARRLELAAALAALQPASEAGKMTATQEE